MSWLELIAQWIHELWPLRIVTSYEQGVRFWLGQDTAELGTGIYAFLPWFGRIEVATVVSDVMDLGVHSVTTKDDKRITWSANVAYRITSARDVWTKVQDFERSLARLAEGHMATRIRDREYAELIADQKALERSLEGTLTTRAKPWGVEIEACFLTDLVEAKQYRVFGMSPLG